MNAKSTKVMNFSNMKTATRTYKMTTRTETTCQVVIKVNGREKCMISFAKREGQLVQTFPSKNTLINPVDLREVMAIAKKALKIS
jgi:hypothetical protein